jgi:peptide/nickel transport system substrate-binding protein
MDSRSLIGRMGIALAAVALGLAACGTPETPPRPSPTEGGTATGGTVRIGIRGSADSLNPGNGVLA